MVRRVTMDNEDTNIKDIYVNVTCPACEKSFNVQMKHPITRKNCSCGKGTFLFAITPMRGVIDIGINYQYDNYQVVGLDANSITIERS